MVVVVAILVFREEPCRTQRCSAPLLAARLLLRGLQIARFSTQRQINRYKSL